MRFAGHRWRAKQRLAGDLLLWSPNHGKRRVGRPAITYIDQLCRDTECLPKDLPALLQDLDGWNDGLTNDRASSTWWWWWNFKSEITQWKAGRSYSISFNCKNIYKFVVQRDWTICFIRLYQKCNEMLSDWLTVNKRLMETAKCN